MRKRTVLRSLLVLGAIGVFILSAAACTRKHAPVPREGAGLLDESGVHEIFKVRDRPHFRFDPVGYLLPQPDLELSWPWEEHPDGRMEARTNNLGFREDEPTLVETRGRRVLVAGDSHTWGFVLNRESFANRLEAALRERLDDAALEVLNAGVPFTGPACYEGVLRKYLYLEPDVFIAALFTGNDFWNDLQVSYVARGETVPIGKRKYWEPLRDAAPRWDGPVSQGLNQVYRFKHFPDEREAALEAVVASYLRMQSLCDENGIEFVALVIPTKMDVDGDDDAETRSAACEALGLDPDDVAINRRLADRFVAAMEREGVRCIDPTDAMEQHEPLLFWREDYHLSVAGHAFVAGVLERDVVPRRTGRTEPDPIRRR